MKLLFLINKTVVTMIQRNTNGTIKARDGRGVIVNAPERVFERAPEPKAKDDLSIPVSLEQLKAKWAKA